MRRIFDDPTHPQYGPVRRLWIILVQLDLLGAAESAWPNPFLPWDHNMAHWIKGGVLESRACCQVIDAAIREWGFK